MIHRDFWLKINQAIANNGWVKDLAGITLRLYGHRLDKYIDVNPLADRNQFYCTGVYKPADYPCDTVTVIGIKGRSNQEQVLWEGTEVSAGTYETQSSISLGDSLENYKKFASHSPAMMQMDGNFRDIVSFLHRSLRRPQKKR